MLDARKGVARLGSLFWYQNLLRKLILNNQTNQKTMNKKALKKSLAGFMVAIFFFLPLLSLPTVTILAYEEYQENGNTYIFGEITKDTTWTSEDSPYIVTGNITVAEDKILTVEPGAEIRFDGWYQINVKGTLDAVGEKENYITFTSNWDNPNAGSWYRISLENSSENNVIQYAVIEYAYIGIQGDNSLVTLKNSILKNLNYGIRHYTGVVSHNYFVNVNTAFENSHGEITDNYISGSTRVFSCTFSETVIHSNNIVNYNSANQNNPYFIDHCYHEDLDATSNYWGTTDENYIKANIYDKDENSWLGEVIYKPYADSLITFNLTEPIDDDLLSSPTETTFSWNSINGPGDILEYYELYIDGELEETDITGTNLNYDISSLSDGYHSWYVVAVNSDGNSYKSNNVFGFNINIRTPHTPIADPVGGWYFEDQSVALSSNNSDIIRYTLDGEDPTETSSEYTSPISITAVEGTTIILKAKAWDNGSNSSPIMTEKYQFDLTPPENVIANPQGGVYENHAIVSLSSEGSDEIRYTTNETEPNELSALYTEPIAINNSTVLKVKAWDEVGNSSEITNEVYNIVQPSYEPPVVTINKLITNNTTPELTGTIDNNDSTVFVIVNGTEYVAVNNSDGTWTLADNTISELQIGIYEIVVRAVKDYYYHIEGYDNTTNELTIKSDEENPSYAVAIDNQKDARPVSGVDEADVVYEFPVEGSITRFMAIYNPDNELDSATQIGPVRSARPYFARTASEHKAIYAHAGGISDALWGLRNHEYSVYNLDALVGAGEQYFWRDETRSAPHNLYTSIENLNNFRDEFELGNGTFIQPWIFSDNPLIMENVEFEGDIEVEYANQNYNVKWIYDDTDGVYYRQSYENGSYQDYIDINTNQVSTENIIIQYAHTDPFTEIWEAEGRALLCREGECVNGRWQKDDSDSNIKFYLINGEEFEFKTGKLWINVVDSTDITPPAPITNVTVENVSTEDELRLEISWTNPTDEDLAKIFICRSSIFSTIWQCGLAENLKGVLGNSIEDNYITPDSTSVVDNYRLVEGGTYYYKLYAFDTSGNDNAFEWEQLEEGSGIPLYDQPIESGIRVDDITWIRNFGATNDTYIDGWKLKFDITVNDPNEDQLKFKMSDWISDSNSIATIGNTKISLVNLNTEADILNATSMGTEYSDMSFLSISDINPLMDKTQTSFYIWTKLPMNTVAGNYRTNYGIQTLTQ